MRIPFVAANWKMFKSIREASAYGYDFHLLVAGIDDVEIVLAPPFTAIHAAAEAVKGTRIGIAGQNVYWEAEGAFTGEVSVGMLKEAGARYVIVGHSERRTKFGETDEQVNRKTKAALAGGLTPIVCIGETLDEREQGKTLAVLDRHVKRGLDGLSAEQVASLAVAYEPVWAIGTGRNATSAQAQEAHAHIRLRLREWFGAEAADACRVIYGGSVKPANTRELVSQADVDGALVGGASLDPRAFSEIVAASRPGRI
ncbi:MAG TPA: triose-phosphate isomerase [Vicinamibacterales bacterium]|jgi:triosephosphate isomerase